MGGFEEGFIKRCYLVVGRLLELSPTDRSSPILIGGPVDLGEPVEDVDYEIQENKVAGGCLRTDI